jgi:hypothetical protein
MLFNSLFDRLVGHTIISIVSLLNLPSVHTRQDWQAIFLCADKSENTMTRKASIHFQPVTNASFSVSHSERTDLSEPAYLLPKEYQLGNQVIDGSLPEVDIALMFARAKDAMTGQAKARGSSHPLGRCCRTFKH